MIFKSYINGLYEGRIDRKNYFLGLLFFIVLFYIGLFLPLVSIDYLPSILEIVLILYYIIFISGCFLYVFSLHIRRLHDRGYSGWWILLGPIDIWLNFFVKGGEITNKYGELPTKDLKFFRTIFNIQ